MVVPGGMAGSAVQTLCWNGVPATRLQAIEIAAEISRQCRAEVFRRPRVLQNHGAILKPQQIFHARLVILPIQRAEHALGIGDQHRGADRR
jgi:hypothetical protein